MKWILRILAGIAIVVGALIALLIGMVVFDGLGDGERLAKLTNTTIPGAAGAPAVRAYVAKPDGAGPFPVVIMIHEFWGLKSSITGKAAALAQEGYLVVAPDTFRGKTTDLIPRAILNVVTTPAEQVNADLDSVFAWLEARPDADKSKVAIAGFCYGGRASLLYSLHNNKTAATVVFYGQPVSDAATLKRLGGPVLGIFGSADNSIPVADVRAFEAALGQAGVPAEITIYEGQPHAFVQDIEGIRAGGAQGKAWAQMLAFLNRSLKGGRSVLPADAPSAVDAPFPWRYYAMLAWEHARGAGAHGH